MTPKRIQLSRAGGWRKPADARVVARPSKWGNPFRVGQTVAEGVQITRAEAVELYREYIIEAIPRSRGELDLGTLSGRDLCCWCPPDEPCHADVLLELANPKETR